MDSQRVQAVYQEHVRDLQRFLLGVLKDEATAADALQSTFIKLMEKGHSVQQLDSLKSWLFRVAFNEAMLVRRREGVSRKHAERVAWRLRTGSETGETAGQRLNQSMGQMIREEEIEMVRTALDELSEVQRAVVEKRIYEGLKFREIAEQLNVPLGTVLARMQSSLKRLKSVLAARSEWEE
jgi:RNA polymerase sigma factor (sigma-70 family)